jgi:hypothetical protein
MIIRPETMEEHLQRLLTNRQIARGIDVSTQEWRDALSLPSICAMLKTSFDELGTGRFTE